MRQNGNEIKKLHKTIEENDAGLSLEQYLRQNLKFTRAQIRSMKFRPEGLLVNGQKVRVTYVLQLGDELTIQLEEEKEASVQLVPAEGPLEILYEDPDLIAVWKESGMVVHPSHGHYQDTLSNRLHGYFQRKGEQVTIRSIGRLDRDTSGILVFAKNQVAAARLWKQKEEGTFWKEYLAVCDGDMSDLENDRWYTIDSPIGKMEGELMKMCVTESGLQAVTHFQVIKMKEVPLCQRGAEVSDAVLVAPKDSEESDAVSAARKHSEESEAVLADQGRIEYLNGQKIMCSRIRVRIDTGRTHQIRVHMASIGHPLIGDILYNPNYMEYNSKSRPALQLCAWKAELLQPFSGELLQISAPQKNVT